MSKLAINGGTPVRTELFPAYNTIGEEEQRAAAEVLASGVLSQYLGGWCEDFYGGPRVRAFEAAWAEAHQSAHAITVNSNTSGLFTAMGAVGIQPGDEVIVSPYTMSASAVAPLIYGGIPIFADIDPVNFCIDPKSIADRITPRTKAILVVHIFGHPADMDEIMAISDAHNLYVVEDCAQAPLGLYKGRPVGTVGHLGVFSLNYHKHIHTGEGGVITTNDAELAERCQLIRNHGENVVGPKGVQDLTNIIGFNYRMTEIECAIGIEQLKKLPRLLEERIDNVRFIEERLKHLPALQFPPVTNDGTRHTYYVHPVKFDASIAGVSRNAFVHAIKAEIPSSFMRETDSLIGAGYVQPLYLQPLYAKRAAWAFEHSACRAEQDYARGLCPVAELMHDEMLMVHEYMRPGMSRSDLMDFANAIEKVFDHIVELQDVSAA